jgi:predicted DNA-binding protein
MYIQLAMKRIRGTLLHIMVTKEIADELKTIAKRQGRTVTELAREAFAKVIRVNYQEIGVKHERPPEAE